jgi:hypothetical protein
MSVVYDLINYLINKNKVFSNGLFIEYTAVVSEYFHHTVDNVVDH